MQIKKIWKSNHQYTLQEIVGLIHKIAFYSRDPHTKVGCAIINKKSNILIMGYNDYPHNLKEIKPSLFERPEKYYWVEHAERNTIYLAGRKGIKLQNSIIVQNLFPCTDCARAIIQTGISKVITYNPLNKNPEFHQESLIRWQKNMEKSLEMLIANKVQVEYIEDLFKNKK